ncbi:MAG: hypothetical protein KDA80_02755 [Planctomycetaceae bacterium]|nr:hypothetical protein [Planctomycetaceae bacterium]
MVETIPPDVATIPAENPTKEKSRLQKGRLSRWVFRVVIVFILLLTVSAYFLPQIASHALKNPETVRWLSPEFGELVEIGDAKIEWGQPVSLNAITLKTRGGQPIAQVQSMKSKRSVWDMLWGTPKPLELQLAGIQFAVQVPDPDSQTKRVSLSSVIEKIESFEIPVPPQPMSVEADAITIHFVGTEIEPIEDWDNISLKYQYLVEQGKKQMVSLRMPRVEGHENRGEFTFGGTWHKQNEESIAFEGDWKDLSSAPLQPWLERVTGPLKGAPPTTGSIQGTMTRGTSGWESVVHATSHLPRLADGGAGLDSPVELIDVKIGIDATYKNDLEELHLEQLSAIGGEGALFATGKVSDLPGQELIDLQGTLKTPGQQLVDFLPLELRKHIVVDGLEIGEFHLQGMGNPPESEPTATASFLVKWQEIEAFGLNSRNGGVRVLVDERTVSASPEEMKVNDGRVHQIPTLDYRNSPTAMTFQEGPVLEDVELSEHVCRTWMKFIAPTLANAVSTKGRFSLESRRGTFLLGQPENSQLSGTLTISQAEVKPGPIIVPILGIIQTVQGMIPGLPVGNLSEMPLLTIQNEEIGYRLEKGRVYHDDFGFSIGNVPLATSGSVGLDESLDLTLSMSIPQAWFPRNGPIAQLLANERLQLRVTGTLEAPIVDARPLADFGKRIGIRAGAGLLENLLNRRRRRQGNE